MSLPVIIRPASPEDAEALLSIYAPYVKHTAITFEYEVPSAEEFRKRIAHTLHYRDSIQPSIQCRWQEP